MRKIYKNFFEGLINFFIFIPYFFSVTTLVKTLFEPWKNLVDKKQTPGFSFGDLFNRINFNLISRAIGFLMRFFLLIFFVLIESFFVVSIPLLILLFVILSPVFYIFSLVEKSNEEIKEELKNFFVQKHSTNQENRLMVEQWFEKIYFSRNKKWWDFDSLFSIPPLARDWAVGYTPTLDSFCEELTSSDYQLKIKNTVGREPELKLIEQALSRTEGANVLMVGDEGVGKDTIINSFAKRVYEGKTNTLLNYKRLLRINFESVLTKYQDQKQREFFIEELFKEAASARNVILIVEDIEKYLSTFFSKIDLTPSFEKALKDSNIHVIATTTPFNFEKFIFRNEKINQLFVRVEVKEVTEKEAFEILLEVIPTFEEKYKTVIPYETAKYIVEKSQYHITNIPFPEKAIEIIDQASVYCLQNKKSVMGETEVDQILTQITHTPVSLDQKTKQTLVDIETILSGQIIGQDEAVKNISSSLRRAFVLLGKRKRPLASFLFFGPTGVGKTETAKALARIFFEDEKHLLRFDMSLYQSEKDIPNLIGSQETQNPGLLTKAIRETPYAVLLLDEIEKAHKNLLNIFLTMLDEGYFTDGFGKNVDCKNLIIVATSNAGSDFIYKQGFNKNDDFVSYLIDKGFFSPEFLNRFDGVIMFNSLEEEAIFKIAKKLTEKLTSNYLSSHKIQLEVSDQTIHDLISKGYTPQFGVRDLERIIVQDLEGLVDKKILEGSVREGQTLKF